MSVRLRSKRSSSGSFVRRLALQDVEAFGIGLHQAIFDAVVDHLDEMARARRAGMDIALLGARILALGSAAGVRGMVPMPGRQRVEDRIEMVDRRPCRRRSSCNSRAPAPTRRPTCRHRHSAACVRRQRLRAADVVLVEAVAAVDDDVAGRCAARRAPRSCSRSVARRAASPRRSPGCRACAPNPPATSRPPLRP